MLFSKKVYHHDHQGSCGCGCGTHEHKHEHKSEHQHSFVNGVCDCGKKEPIVLDLQAKEVEDCGCDCGESHSDKNKEKDDGGDEDSESSHHYEDGCCSSEGHKHEHSFKGLLGHGDNCGCDDHSQEHIHRSEACASSTEKMEFVIEGLHCAGCAGKIENKVRALKEVDNAEMNFAISTLNAYINSSDKDALKRQIIKIVEETEPGTTATLKDDLDGKEVEFELKGLNCAACAGKIERNVKELPGVVSTSLNFAISKFEVKIDNLDVKGLYEQVEKIVKDLEPDVEVILNTGSEDEIHVKKDNNKKKGNSLLMRMGVAIGFLGIGMVFRGESFELIPFLIAYLIVGYDIIKRSISNIKRGEVFDENFLMTIASAAALYVGEHPEAVLVMLLYQIGEYFQGRAVESSRKSIANLMDIRPDYANIKIGNDIKKVSPNDVKVGDIIVVKAGEKVPLDGIIIEGSSSVDTKALTGESAPMDVAGGDEITSGFINIDGLLTVEVKKRFKDSAVSRILDLVQNASAKKAKTELRITKFARYYTPVVVIIAALTAIIPSVFFGGNFNDWLLKAATFLVVSCPCALVISVPMTYFAGLGASSKRGILVKGGNYLEALSKAGVLVFDKTGTLTKGNFKVDKIHAEKDISKDEILRLTAHVESFSNHPIAVSIVNEYGKDIDKSIIKEYKEVKGKGVQATIGGKKVISGNLKFIKDNNIQVEESKTPGTIVYTAIDGQFAGFITISDEIKEDSKKAIQGFSELGINNVVMLTGDRKITADAVAQKLGITKYKYELLPNHKVDEVEKLIESKGDKSLVFVGDGINDAPVLARADVGVAMGGVGSDAAIEAADVVIMNDEPSKLIDGIKIARKTKKIVNQNIFFSLAVKIGIMVLTFFLAVPMWLAVFGDVGVALLAVFNAMRVLRD
ncbi:heavy metal translocating P-type ATPase [Oceanirhabdus seepicola]|nr:heavy metal translocating P-type ATPase [Oceanirhabdus seepicola]